MARSERRRGLRRSRGGVRGVGGYRQCSLSLAFVFDCGRLVQAFVSLGRPRRAVADFSCLAGAPLALRARRGGRLGRQVSVEDVILAINSESVHGFSLAKVG